MLSYILRRSSASAVAALCLQALHFLGAARGADGGEAVLGHAQRLLARLGQRRVVERRQNASRGLPRPAVPKKH